MVPAFAGTTIYIAHYGQHGPEIGASPVRMLLVGCLVCWDRSIGPNTDELERAANPGRTRRASATFPELRSAGRFQPIATEDIGRGPTDDPRHRDRAASIAPEHRRRDRSGVVS